MRVFFRRMLGAAVLDKATYEEVEADPTATTQAFVAVLIVSATIGIGAFGFDGQRIEGVFVVGIAALLGWASWALLTYEIGRRLPVRETRTDVGELLRTLGFSAAPGVLAVVGILPNMAIPAFALAFTWMSISMVVAVRQALDYDSTMRAISVCVLAWALSLGMVGLLGAWFGVVART
jgi:Yip1-like protein